MENKIKELEEKLLRKEKECEELKADVKHKELEIQDWIKQYKLAHQKRIKLQTKYNKLEQKANKYIHDIVDENVKDISNISKVCKSLEKENNKLKQALQEIKKIAEPRFVNGLNEEADFYNTSMDKIRQIISEVENG